MTVISLCNFYAVIFIIVLEYLLTMYKINVYYKAKSDRTLV